jgi:hypothetical protein
MPMLYLGRSPMFSAREIGEVSRLLKDAVGKIAASARRPLYSLQACRIDDHVGFYARDFFNRSVHRMHLRRGGVTFADDFFARLTRDGTFECDEWGEIVPQFVIVRHHRENPKTLRLISGARLIATVAACRFGTIGETEFRSLARLFSSVVGIGCDDVEALVTYVAAG